MPVSWTSINIAWLAGIIEGEGCIPLNKSRALVIVKMTDEDVIRKIHTVIGLGAVTGPIIKGHHLPSYKWQVAKAEDVYAICAAIYPFMCARRGQRILELLAWYASKPPILHKMHGTATRYRRMGCRCEPCRAAGAAARC